MAKVIVVTGSTRGIGKGIAAELLRRGHQVTVSGRSAEATEAAVADLAVPDMAKLQYVFDAVSSIRRALNGRVPLIGFSGSPWTLACYMVEGAGSDDYRLVKTMMYRRPDLMHRILEINADAVALYLNTQIEAGAQAVMVFDSWGGVLADGAFQEFSLAYNRRVLKQLKREHAGARIPHIVFTKGGGLWLEQIAQSVDGVAPDVVGLDWTMNLGLARKLTGDRVALQGNLDPNVLFAEPAQIRAEAAKVLESFGAPRNAQGGYGGHVFNLGHGISQHTPPQAVSVLVDAVHEVSRRLRAAA